MLEIAKLLWAYRKVALYVLLVIAALVAVQRVYAWHGAYVRLDEVQARLDAEIDCTVDSTCHKRAAELAEQARLEAEAQAQDALRAAQMAEDKARAEAAAWRRRYDAAKRDDPACAEWSSRPIACPVE